MSLTIEQLMEAVSLLTKCVELQADTSDAGLQEKLAHCIERLHDRIWGA